MEGNCSRIRCRGKWGGIEPESKPKGFDPSNLIQIMLAQENTDRMDERRFLLSMLQSIYTEIRKTTGVDAESASFYVTENCDFLLHNNTPQASFLLYDLCPGEAKGM